MDDLRTDAEVQEIDASSGLTTLQVGNARIVSGSVEVGPYSLPGGVKAVRRVRVSGFDLAKDKPEGVFLQTRNQQPGNTVEWRDHFAVQVMETKKKSILVSILRLDVFGAGWSQKLRLDLQVIEKIG